MHDRFHQVIHGHGNRAAFIPWIYSVAAKVRSITLEKMASRPIEMSLAVTECARLFGQQVVSVNLDPTVWLEAVGCQVEWRKSGPAIIGVRDSLPNPEEIADADQAKVGLEAIDRVRGALPPGNLVACGAIGPATLAWSLGLDAQPARMEEFMVGELVTEIARLVCSKPIDLLVVMEDVPVSNDALS